MNYIPSNSFPSLCTLHAIEHSEPGRCVDLIDPLAHKKAIAKMKRFLSRVASILFGVPVGVQPIEFDGHRIFEQLEVIRLFGGFKLVASSVSDENNVFHESDCRRLPHSEVRL